MSLHATIFVICFMASTAAVFEDDDFEFDGRRGPFAKAWKAMTDAERKQMLAIEHAPGLTKQQKADRIEALIKKSSRDVQEAHRHAKEHVKDLRGRVEKDVSKLSPAVQAVVKKLQAIYDNPQLTSVQETVRIAAVLKSTPAGVKQELSDVKAKPRSSLAHLIQAVVSLLT